MSREAFREAVRDDFRPMLMEPPEKNHLCPLLHRRNRTPCSKKPIHSNYSSSEILWPTWSSHTAKAMTTGPLNRPQRDETAASKPFHQRPTTMELRFRPVPYLTSAVNGLPVSA
jgi:hypothetical protein